MAEGANKTASIGSKDMVADAFTKELPGPAFLDLKKRLNLMPAMALLIDSIPSWRNVQIDSISTLVNGQFVNI